MNAIDIDDYDATTIAVRLIAHRALRAVDLAGLPDWEELPHFSERAIDMISEAVDERINWLFDHAGARDMAADRDTQDILSRAAHS